MNALVTLHARDHVQDLGKIRLGSPVMGADACGFVTTAHCHRLDGNVDQRTKCIYRCERSSAVMYMLIRIA